MSARTSPNAVHFVHRGRPVCGAEHWKSASVDPSEVGCVLCRKEALFLRALARAHRRETKAVLGRRWSPGLR